MASLKFLIQSKRNPANIYLRIRDGKDIDLKTKTGFVINPSNWSTAKQKPINARSPELKILSFELESLKVRILQAYNEASLLKVRIDSNWMKSAISGNPNHVKNNNLIDYCDKFIERKTQNSSKRDIQKYQVLRQRLEEFESNRKSPFRLNDVSIEFQNGFLDFLSNTYSYRQTTKHRTIKFLKTVCRDARNNGHEVHPQMDSLGVKDGKVNIIYLTPKEIQMIEKVKLDFSYLENARDWLLLSCYLGQRGGDLLRCTRKNITRIEEETVLDIRQEKTDKPVYVLLLKEAKKILENNKGEFPRKISVQNFNIYIKEVCKAAGINDIVFGSKVNPLTNRKEDGYYEKWELVTSHIGRRSFATNYYGKLPTPFLMAQTGHSTEAMFLKYIGKGRTESLKGLALELRKLKDG
ncbi:site-specific integrase [Jiulongibacter sediminis]|uniref:site-specific integrase n=1 Tax=Jiulongibacter sediminis TaxID=1605367 RepID=UPI0026EC7E25|nr:site-specific integrase [Jiulongibacter sediminis]